ncbi:unnamed protein product, partial [Polarella glacialis]
GLVTFHQSDVGTRVKLLLRTRDDAENYMPRLLCEWMVCRDAQADLLPKGFC